MYHAYSVMFGYSNFDSLGLYDTTSRKRNFEFMPLCRAGPPRS